MSGELLNTNIAADVQQKGIVLSQLYRNMLHASDEDTDEDTDENNDEDLQGATGGAANKQPDIPVISQTARFFMKEDLSDDDREEEHWSPRIKRGQPPVVQLSPDTVQMSVVVSQSARMMFKSSDDDNYIGAMTRGKFKRIKMDDSDDDDIIVGDVGDEERNRNINKNMKKAAMVLALSQPAQRTAGDKWLSKKELSIEVKKRNWIDVDEIHFVDHQNHRRKKMLGANLDPLFDLC